MNRNRFYVSILYVKHSSSWLQVTYSNEYLRPKTVKKLTPGSISGHKFGRVTCIPGQNITIIVVVVVVDQNTSYNVLQCGTNERILYGTSL